MLEEELSITCPYCYESISLLVDCTAGNQSYVEDCSVCCQPIVVDIELTADGDIASVAASAENR